MRCQVSGQDAEMICFPPHGYGSAYLAESEFSGLWREASWKELETLLCSSRRDATSVLRAFPFKKLKYYPNSCSVLILQSHSRKK